MAGFRVAERRKAKLRLGLAGASGSGKTASALLIAYGLCGDWSKIGIIDTENGSADLYVGATISNTKIGQYNVLPLTAPYEPSKYTEGIHAAEEAGFEVVILDSLSHAWAGEGGLLDKHGKLADRGQNSFTAWRTITPEHNKLVETMLQSKVHLIATLRTKTEYALEDDDRGKKVPKKIGMAPIQRDGMEYEFTLFLELDEKHVAKASKDRTNLFDGKLWVPGPATGKTLLAWLEAGTASATAAPVAQQPATADGSPAQPEAAPPPAAEPAAEGSNLFGEPTPPAETTPPAPAAPEAKASQTVLNNFWKATRKAGIAPETVISRLGATKIEDLTRTQLLDLFEQLSKEAAADA